MISDMWFSPRIVGGVRESVLGLGCQSVLGLQVCSLEGHFAPVSAAALSLDGERAVTDTYFTPGSHELLQISIWYTLVEWMDLPGIRHEYLPRLD